MKVNRAKEQLATEVAQLRQRVAELEAAETERRQAEEALRKSEEKYRTVVEISPDGIAISAKGRHLFVNQSLARMFGVSSPDELVGRPIMDYIHPDYRKIVRARLEEQTKRGASVPLIEEKMIRADGTIIHTEVAAAPLEYEGEQAVLAVIRDITERKRIEDALRESEEKYRTLYEGMAQGVFYQRNDGVLIDVNPAALEMFGLSRDQFLGSTSSASYWKVICEDGSDLPGNEHPSMVALKTGKPVKNVIAGVFNPEKRDYVWININAIPQFRPGEDKPYQVFVTIHDITERKQAEVALRESEAKYRNLVERANDGISIAQNAILQYVNPRLAQITGYSVEELIGLPFSDFFIPEEVPKVVDHYKQRMAGKGVTPIYESALRHKNGSRIEVELNAGIISYKGKPADMVMVRDITERKRAEEELRESEEHYRILFDEALDGICLADAETGIIMDCNQALAALVGRERAELIGRPQKILHPPQDDQGTVSPTFKQHLADKQGQILETQVVTRQGDIREVEIKANLLDIRGRKLLQGIFRDITERKHAEAVLRESEEKYRVLFDAVPVGIGISDLEGTVYAGNQSAQEITGYTLEELKTIKMGDLYVDPDERKQMLQVVDESGQVRDYEVRMKRKDGTVYPVLLNIDQVELEGRKLFLTVLRDITERMQMEKALQESEKEIRMIAENVPALFSYIGLDGRYRFINKRYKEWFGIPQKEIIGRHYRDVLGEATYELIKDRVEATLSGKRVYYEELVPYAHGGPRWVAAVYVPDVNDRQEVKGFFALVTDITERKRAEEALLESEGKYRSLVESSEDSIYLVDKDSTYLFMNKKHLSRLGVQSNQVIGRPYSEFHSPAETKDFAQKVEKVLKTGKVLSYEYRSQRDNRYFIRTLSPAKASKGAKTSAITVISKDVTELKCSEEALREREAFNYALFQYNPVETIVVDLEGRVTGFNLTKEKSGNRLPATGDMMYKDYAGKHEIDMRAELMRCIRSGKAKEFPERRYDDKYLSITISPFSKGALIISEDISERKGAEELLQRERDTFFSILQKAPYGVVFLDKDGKTIFINTEFTAITGYTLKDVSTLKDWYRQAYPDKKYRDMVINTMEKDFIQDNGDEVFQKAFHRAFFRTFQVTCKDGTIKEIEFRPTALEDGSTIVMIADITERKRMHELLETAVTEWRTTFDAISDAVCLLDQKGRIKRCNIAMMKMIGKPFSEVTDRTCWEVFHGVSKPPQGCPLVTVEETHQRETEVLLKNNSWLNISVDPLLDDKGNLLGAVHITSDITERMQAEKELQSSREELRNLTAYLESVREQERTNIAREIHDELAQSLTALKMDLSWLNNRLPRDQMPLVEKTRSMSDLIDTIIQTVKRISAELRPGILDDLGLVAAIEWQAEEFQDRTGITCRVTVDPVDLIVDKDRSTSIFRIFQETLTNIARHAGATRITVNLKGTAEALTLRVSDNGAGITDEQIRDSKSFGLIGMRERVYPWGGQVNITGTPGEGTTVEVKVPVEKN